jgi:hypothetical protein
VSSRIASTLKASSSSDEHFIVRGLLQTTRFRNGAALCAFNGACGLSRELDTDSVNSGVLIADVGAGDDGFPLKEPGRCSATANPARKRGHHSQYAETHSPLQR